VYCLYTYWHSSMAESASCQNMVSCVARMVVEEQDRRSFFLSKAVYCLYLRNASKILSTHKENNMNKVHSSDGTSIALDRKGL
jgi:uncharacterized lipoprotein NlpE involved in copper resistance